MNTESTESEIHTDNDGKSEALAKLYKIAGKQWGINNTKFQDAFICPEEEGHFRSPSDCAVYYRCVHGVGVRYECGFGLLWNSETGLCDWSHRVKHKC